MSAASGLEHLKPFLPGLESALEDSEVSEIMINGPANVWVERAGRLAPHPAPDLDEAALERAAIHIARPLGLDPASSPIVDARLDDGSRVAICVPPASPQALLDRACYFRGVTRCVPHPPGGAAGTGRCRSQCGRDGAAK